MTSSALIFQIFWYIFVILGTKPAAWGGRLFFRDLGVNILRNMMVRCVENIVNTDIFSKSQIFEFFDILGSRGTAWDLILEAFRMPGAAFWDSGRVLGIWCDMAALAGWAGGVPGFR